MGWRHASCCPRRSPSPPCADARRGHEPSGTRRAAVCPHFPPGSTPRAVTAPLSPRVAHVSLRTPVTVCPPAPRLRSSRLPLADSLCRRSPLAPPAGWAAVLCAASRPGHLLPYGIAASASDSLCPRFPLSSLPDGLPPLSPTLCAVASPSPPAGWAAASASDHLDRLLSVPSPPHPLMPDGMSSSEPRSVRADVIPGSERHAPTCHASAGRGSAPRRPGERSAPPPVGRAAEPARSAARASPGHPPPHSVRALYPRPLSPP